MKKIFTFCFVLVCLLSASFSKAQLLLPAVNTPSVITFSGFTGAGFEPTPLTGELSSNTWAVNGMSDGTLAFGGTMNLVNTDFTRGVNNGGTAVGGLYAFDVNGDTTMGVQPIGTDFTPGDIILKLQNTTGVTMTSLYAAYDLWINNDQGRSNLFNFSYSTDNIVYVPVTALFDTSAVLADTLVWQLKLKKTLITGLNIANNGFVYFKWHGDDVGGAGSRDEFAIDNITAIPNPDPINADFSASAYAFCLGDTVCFVDSSSSLMGNITSWTWSFGDGGVSSLPYPCYGYAAAGTYSVKLVVKDNLSNKDSITQTITVHPIPVPNFSANTVCLGDVTQFADMSTVGGGSVVTMWDWDFGDGGFHAPVQNPTKTFGGSGIQIVTLCVTTNDGCSACTTMTITVNPRPVAGYTYASNGCASTTINFQDASQPGANGNITNWDWDFGDGNTSIQQTPSHAYQAGGIYAVSLIVTNNFGCSDTMVQQVPVGGVLPVAQIGTADTCFGTPMLFADQSTIAAGTIVSWDWNFGDGNSALTQNAQHTYAAAGQYNVRLIVTSNQGCKDTAFQVVVVAPAVTAGYTYIGNGNTVTFTSSVSGGVPGYTYDWDFGDGMSDSQMNPIHTFSGANMSYLVCLTVYDSYGCSDSICKNVSVEGIFNQENSANIQIYPNPSSGIFMISSEKGRGKMSVKNLLGEELLPDNEFTGNKTIIDLSGQPAGIYYLQLTLPDGRAIQHKLIRN
jgi:PKD repeat protein